jgi:hypothetical protein
LLAVTIGPRPLFVNENHSQLFEVDAYPEAKVLNAVELKALHQRHGDWFQVAELIGASEAFARQNGKNNDA